MCSENLTEYLQIYIVILIKIIYLLTNIKLKNYYNTQIHNNIKKFMMYL